MQNSLPLISQITLLLLAIGFIMFLFQISPGFHRMLKRNRKIHRRLKNIRNASKSKDYEI